MEILWHLFYGAGAVLSWLFKGCRTSFTEESSDKNKLRNGIIGAVLAAILIGIVIYVNNRPH